MKIEFVKKHPSGSARAVTAFFIFEGGSAAAVLKSADKTFPAKLSRQMERAGFGGKLGQTLIVAAPEGFATEEIALTGTGSRDKWNEHNAELAAAYAFHAAKGAKALVIDVSAESPSIAAHAALGVRLASYRFDKYRTKQSPDARQTLTAVYLVTRDPARAAKALKSLEGLAEGIFIARDLVSEPANVLYPAEFARRVKALSRVGLRVEVLGEREMQKLGMGALLGVGQGSARESQLAILQWKGAKNPKAAPVAFVGKGVCFDTGGISLKPSDRMEEMIIDMAGAAAVTGAMYALAARKAKVNAVGILGLVENMPDGAAQRPGDIVKTMSGQTVEVINTDAEGRLVLADALYYCQSRFKPRFMVDLATLTGVIMSALGTDIGGLFCNDATLTDHLLKASSVSHDKLWPFPMPEEYGKSLESRAADMKHVGDRFGGAITAAMFIQKFVNNTPWAHLDVGMTVWKSKSSVPTSPDGATGYGVRLLDRLVADFYEDK